MSNGYSMCDDYAEQLQASDALAKAADRIGSIYTELPNGSVLISKDSHDVLKEALAAYEKVRGLQ